MQEARPRLAILALAPLALAAACAAPPRSAAHPAADAPAPEEPRTFACEAAYGHCLLMADDLMLWAQRTRPNELVLRVVELTGEGEPRTTRIPCTAERPFLACCARDSRELFVLCGPEAGAVVLERWWLDEPDGAATFHVTPAASACGVPLPPLPPVVARPRDLSTPDIAAPPAWNVERVEVGRAVLDGRVGWSWADPEGRYLLLITQAPCSVVQWRLTGELQVLADETSLPALRHVETAGFAQHAALGRLMLLTARADRPGAEDLHLVLEDRDNRGEFARPVVLTDTQWRALGFEGEVWLRWDLRDWCTPEVDG